MDCLFSCISQKQLRNTVDIAKIKRNIGNLIDLNDQTYDHTNTEIGVVCDYLHTSDTVDNGIGLFGNLLISAVSLIGSIEALPAAPFIAWLLSGIVNDLVETPPPKLNIVFSQIKERYNITSMEIDRRLADIYANVEANLEKEFKIPDNLFLPAPYDTKKTFKIRELADCTIPDAKTPDFERCKDAHVIGFRKELTKQQLPLTDITIAAVYEYVTLYYTLDKVISPGSENDMWRGCYPGGGLNYIDNWDIPGYFFNGNSRTRINCDSVADFNTAAGKVCSSSGGLLVVKTGGDNSHVEYHKYYLVNGFSEDSQGGWRLIDKTLADWLFMDDGFGKVTNNLGVAKREEIFRKWKIRNSDRLPADKT